MAGIYHPSRGGVRGGQDQFKWDDVKTDKDRENYLGHSVMVPVGKWQEGKDLIWYTRDKNDQEATEAELKRRKELQSVKDLENRAMAAALGRKTYSDDVTGLTVKELKEVLSLGKTGTDEDDNKDGTKRSKKKKKKDKKKKKKKHKKQSEDESDQEMQSDNTDEDNDRKRKRSTDYNEKRHETHSDKRKHYRERSFDKSDRDSNKRYNDRGYDRKTSSSSYKSSRNDDHHNRSYNNSRNEYKHNHRKSERSRPRHDSSSDE